MRRALAIVVVFAACGGGSASPTTASTATTVKRATSAQFAAVVAAHRGAIESANGVVQACLIAPGCAFLGRDAYRSLQTEAAALEAELRALGSPPEDAFELGRDTISLANAVATVVASTEEQHCMEPSFTAACTPLVSSTRNQAARLVAVFPGWERFAA
jgi:hypothetical protein